MKKKTVYLFKIQPKNYNNAVELSFGFLPTQEDVVEVLKSMIAESRRVDSKMLYQDCIGGISTWGLPRVSDIEGNYIQWKTKGESIYSSKGVTVIKPMICYLKG